MKERDFERLIKAIDAGTVPPKGLRDDILARVRTLENPDDMPAMSNMEGFFFRKPLLASFALAIVISGVLWAIAGNGYAGVLYSMIGIG